MWHSIVKRNALNPGEEEDILDQSGTVDYGCIIQLIQDDHKYHITILIIFILKHLSESYTKYSLTSSSPIYMAAIL